VHLNGTHGPDLLWQLDLALKALRTARDEIMNAAPHGRDYYPTNQEARAHDEHRRRVERIDGVINELTQMRDHVHESIELREQAKKQGKN
jgi:hypothetical protein